VLGYGLIPLPLAQERLGRLLLGFAAITGAFSWIVARRYEIEGDLRRSQQRLQAVLSSLPVVLWAINRDGEFTLAEGRRLEVLDVPPRQLVGRSLFELSRDVPEAIASARRVLAGETFTGAVMLGNVVVETRYSPLRDHQGVVTGAIGVSLDVTDRQATQETLRASERRLQTIINAEPACVKLVSRDGIVLDVNRAGLEMLGAKALSEVKGRPVKDIVHADDLDRFVEVHDAALAGRPGRAEFRITGFDGSEHWVDSHVVPFDVAGTPGTERTVLSVTSVVTERKQLEAQLQQAQKLEAIGLLAGAIAHDFNNLLTAIGGYTEMVLASFEESDRRREDLLEVSKAAQRAAALTRQLLAVSRRQVLQPTVLDVNAMVTSSQKLLHRTVPENIAIQLDLTPAPNMVRADRGQLEQVVLNLGINAGDAMPRGGRLTIATQSVDVDLALSARRPPMPPGRYVRLRQRHRHQHGARDTGAHLRTGLHHESPRH
jgi:two-component system, cell cycle sensor histidine kinase and response regulator CckA